MDADYGRQYRALYERHWWWRTREALLLETLTRRRPPAGWSQILDVGCGDGLFFDQLLRFGDVEGVEPAGDLVDARGPHRHRIHIAPFDTTFQPDRRYSLILMLDVLEHLDDPAGALSHAVSLLAPGGTILVTVPAFRLLWTGHDDVNHHRTRFTRRTFRQLASTAGLRIDEERYWFQWTFLAKIATRAFERVVGAQPKPAQIPPGWINRALSRWSWLEHRLLGPIRPPFGSSLVVIGGDGKGRDTSVS